MAIELNNLKNTDVEELKIEDLINIPLIKGEPNTLQIGTVENGENASATITGKAPNQILNLVLPYGKTNSLSVGTVEEGIQANVEIVGEAPNQIINFVIPTYNDTEVKTDITNLKTTKADKTELLSLGLTLGNKISISIDPTTYIMTLELLNSANTVLSTATIDLPLETMVVNARYDNATKELIIVLQNGTELKVPIGDIVSGLVNETTFNNAVKILQEQITANNDELNNLVAEVSDNTKEIRLLKTEQTLQNDRIQENTNKNIEQDTEIEKLKSNLINLSVEGENISVNDSSDLSAKIDVRGNTKQERTEGINEYPFSTIEIPVRYGFVEKDINMEANQEYTFSFQKIISSANKTKFLIIFKNDTKSKEIYYDNVLSQTIILDFKATKVRFYTAENYSVGFDISAKYEGIMLNKGKPKSYEPYTGGQASPNPDYPQEVECVKGNVEVKQTGKNLLNKSKKNQDIICNFPIGTKLTLTTKDGFKSDGGNIMLFREDNSIIWFASNEGTTEKTITLPDRVVKYRNALNYKTPNIEYCLAVGEDKSYEPYKETIYPLTLGNIELNKIGDSQDYFHRINGKWNLHKEIEKYVFAGNEIWQQQNYGKNRFSTILEKSALDNQRQPIISNNFQNETRQGVENYGYGFVQGITAFLYYDSTLEQWKQLLKDKYAEENPVYIMYQLKTPEEIEILDTTLIEQLDNLEKAQTFKGTNILTNNSIAEMKLNYIADTKTYIDNIIATTNKAIVASEGGN